MSSHALYCMDYSLQWNFHEPELQSELHSAVVDAGCCPRCESAKVVTYMAALELVREALEAA